MTTSPYMPNNDDERADLLEHLAATLPTYAALLEISAQELDGLKADSVSFRYSLYTMGIMQANAQKWTNTKNELRDGGSGSDSWPTPPLLPEPIPPMVKPGIMSRLSALAARIKTHKNYTTAIGYELWLIGGEQKIDPSTWQPVLSSYLQAGHPVIVWNKGKASAVEIWVDRTNDNNFVLLSVNTKPNVTDLTPLPAGGSGALWKYKAIYHLDDQPVGLWSNIISVTVGV